MDKLKLTNHIKDIDLKNKMFKVIDKANSCIKNYDVKSTEFLNPYEVKNAVAILNSTNEINTVWMEVMNKLKEALYLFIHFTWNMKI